LTPEGLAVARGLYETAACISTIGRRDIGYTLLDLLTLYHGIRALELRYILASGPCMTIARHDKPDRLTWRPGSYPLTSHYPSTACASLANVLPLPRHTQRGKTNPFHYSPSLLWWMRSRLDQLQREDRLVYERHRRGVGLDSTFRS
jgi:hypothetical protein